jgi:biotin-(acetyl-CoA carboxylase) ligase
MTNYERVQALLRSQEYIEDLNKVKKRFSMTKVKEFFKKYRLNDIIIDEAFVSKYRADQIEEMAIFSDDTDLPP